MTEEQIMQAPIEEVIDRWCELYKTSIQLAVCINEKRIFLISKILKVLKNLLN